MARASVSLGIAEIWQADRRSSINRRAPWHTLRLVLAYGTSASLHILVGRSAGQRCHPITNRRPAGRQASPPYRFLNPSEKGTLRQGGGCPRFRFPVFDLPAVRGWNSLRRCGCDISIRTRDTEATPENRVYARLGGQHVADAAGVVGQSGHRQPTLRPLCTPQSATNVSHQPATADRPVHPHPLPCEATSPLLGALRSVAPAPAQQKSTPSKPQRGNDEATKNQHGKPTRPQ
jgi:hypothetical protein